jgi:hypothetical protein
MTRGVFLVGLIAVAGCAARQPAQTYVAPNDQTIVASTEEAQGTSIAHTIYITNLSTVPVRVYSVSLRSCENVKQQCDSPQKLDIRVRPGGRAFIARVEPRTRDLGFSYRYGYSWREDSSSTKAMISTLAAAGVEPARAQLAAIQNSEAAQAAQVGVHDEELDASQIESLRPRITSLRMEPDSLVIPVNGVVSLDRAHLMLIGTNGERLGRVRELRWRMRSGVARFAPPDSIIGLKPGRTVAEFMLPPGVSPADTTPLPSATLTLIVRP